MANETDCSLGSIPILYSLPTTNDDSEKEAPSHISLPHEDNTRGMLQPHNQPRNISIDREGRTYYADTRTLYPADNYLLAQYRLFWYQERRHFECEEPQPGSYVLAVGNSHWARSYAWLRPNRFILAVDSCLEPALAVTERPSNLWFHGLDINSSESRVGFLHAYQAWDHIHCFQLSGRVDCWRNWCITMWQYAKPGATIEVQEVLPTFGRTISQPMWVCAAKWFKRAPVPRLWLNAPEIQQFLEAAGFTCYNTTAKSSRLDTKNKGQLTHIQSLIQQAVALASASGEPQAKLSEYEAQLTAEAESLGLECRRFTISAVKPQVSDRQS